MHRPVLGGASYVFERLERSWEGTRAQHLIGSLLVVSFLLGLLTIELNLRGWLPAGIAGQVPRNHFYAVELAFTLLLIVEIASLIFVLERSVSSAVGKQIEILSLILLRQSFKEFIYFNEPIGWDQVRESLMPMVSDACGALLIFVVLGFYYRMQRHLPITADAQDQASFVSTKRLVSLALLIIFVIIGVGELGAMMNEGRAPLFFEKFYTVMILTDVLIVLISLRYSTTYHVVFRNSGYALAAVFIRLALIAPPPFNAAIGLGVALFAVGLTMSYNSFAPMLMLHPHHEEAVEPVYTTRVAGSE